MGSYLNHGAVVGNAVGFKLSSLWKVSDVRATRAGRTLLHLVSQQVGNESAIEIEEELVTVTSAAKLSLENVRSELNGLIKRMRSLEEALKEKNDPLLMEYA